MKQYDNFCFLKETREIGELYVSYKRSLGLKCGYQEQSRINSMLKFICDHSTNNKTWALTPEVVYSYTVGSGKDHSRTIHLKQSMIRQFALFLKLQGVETFIMPRELIKISNDFTPYIFTKDEIQSILYHADRIGPNKNKFINTPYVHPAIIRVLYGTGLRIGEALALLHNDVDLDNGVITIRNGKNNASRLVPISDSLREYLYSYENNILRESNPYFFPALRGERYSDITVRNNFKKMLIKSGIEPLSTGYFPRLHDLRYPN